MLNSFKQRALACTLLISQSATILASKHPSHLLRQGTTEDIAPQVLKEVGFPEGLGHRNLLETTQLNNGGRLAAAFTSPDGGTSFPLDSTCSYDVSVGMEGSVGLGENDISYVFIIDESGSVSQALLNNMRTFFTGLVDILFAESATKNIGAVRFSSSQVSTPLQTDATTIKAFLTQPKLGGGTNCVPALNLANSLINANAGTKTIVIFGGDGGCAESDSNVSTAANNLRNNANSDVDIQVIAIGGVTCSALDAIAPAEDCQEVTLATDYDITDIIGTTLENILFSDNGLSNFAATTSTSGCTFPEDGPIFCQASSASAVSLGLGENEVCVKAIGRAATTPDTDEEAVECMKLIGEDNIDPSFTCPADHTVDTDAGKCYATVLNLPDHVDKSDNCGLGLATKDPSGPVFAQGSTTVTYGLFDSSGNAATTCTIDVIVSDNEDPDVTCPSDYTINTDPGVCVAEEPCIPEATATDNCGVASFSSDAPSTFTEDTTTVTWTAVDTSGNDDQCSFDVTLEDNESPTVSCIPGDNPGGNLPNSVSSNGFFLINASDNCDTPTITLLDQSGHIFTEFTFLDGDMIKYTGNNSQQGAKLHNGQGVDYQINGHGNLILRAVDDSGNESTVVCVVPPRD